MTLRLPALLAASLRAVSSAVLPRLLAVALAGAVAAPAAAQYAEPVLGRLFTAPEERTRIDRDRASAPMNPVAAAEMAPPAPPPVVEAPPPPPAPVRFTGVVRRSDGRATVWVNDEPRETRLENYRPGGAIPVDTPGGPVLAKPGQSIDPNDGAARDAR